MFTLPQPEHIYTSKDLLGCSKIWARLPGGLIESVVSCSLWMMDSAVSLLLQSLDPRCAWLEEFSFFLKILMKSKPNINSFSVCLSGGPMSSIFILENLVTSVAEPVHFWPALAPSIFFHRLQLRLWLQLL